MRSRRKMRAIGLFVDLGKKPGGHLYLNLLWSRGMKDAYLLSEKILKVWSVVEYPLKGIHDVVQHFDREPDEFFFCLDFSEQPSAGTARFRLF